MASLTNGDPNAAGYYSKVSAILYCTPTPNSTETVAPTATEQMLLTQETATAVATATAQAQATATQNANTTATAQVTATFQANATATQNQQDSYTPTPSPTKTWTPTWTASYTATPSYTSTSTPSFTKTRTPTFTQTYTFTNTATWTDTPTIIPCGTNGTNFFNDGDILNSQPAGSTTGATNPSTGNPLTITGGGSGIGNTSDQFHYHWTNLAGPGTIMAHLVTVGGGSGTPESGIMIRNGSNTFSAYAYLYMQYSGSVTFEARTSDAVNSSGQTYVSGDTYPQWLELIYDGTQITAWTAESQWGVWYQVGPAVTITLTNGETWGLTATSNSQSNACTAVYDYFCVTGQNGFFTPTITPTPLAAGPTATQTPTNTPLGSPTPTITATVTTTFTPWLPTPPPAGACAVPVTGVTSNLMGGSPQPVYCFNNNCGTSHAVGSGPCTTLISDVGVFGMSLGEIRNIADNYGTSLGGSPVTLFINSNWQLSYFTGNLTYDPPIPPPTKPCKASGSWWWMET